LNLVY